MSRLVGLCLAAALIGAPAVQAAPAAKPSPRQAVNSVAKAIEDNYFDVARARTIGGDLRAAADVRGA